MRRKKKEGHPLPETPEMKMWRDEFEQMSEEEHKMKLKNLGLTDEEVNEIFSGKAEKEINEVIEETPLKETKTEKKTKSKKKARKQKRIKK